MSDSHVPLPVTGGALMKVIGLFGFFVIISSCLFLVFGLSGRGWSWPRQAPKRSALLETPRFGVDFHSGAGGSP